MRYGFISKLSVHLILLTVSIGLSAEPQRPNIIIIMSDDHAVKAVSAYDKSLMQTPNIDRIADRGMRFNRAYVANSICGPSRATLLTGAHSHVNGFYSNEWFEAFDGEQPTFPSLLQEAGYQTSIIGKWHLYSDPVGFDHWEVIDNAREQGTYYNPHFRTPEGVEEATGYVSNLVTDKSIDWLRSVKVGKEPFLLIYSHKAPHRLWLPGPDELAQWDETLKIQEPDSLFRDMSKEVSARRNAQMSIADMGDRDVKLKKPLRGLTPKQEAQWEAAFSVGNRELQSRQLTEDEMTRWKYQRYIKTYIGTVQSMDRQIGRLLDFLESEQLADNTIVVYMSDQGFFLGENGWFDKRWIDDTSSRIPLLVQWPGNVKPGSESNSLVQNIDFAPTLLEAAGLEPAATMQGKSILPLLRGEEWDRDLYYHFYENPGSHNVARHYGIISKRFKLVHYYQNSEWELFDLQSDPDEQTNVYGKASYADTRQDLLTRLTTLRELYRVPDTEPEPSWMVKTLLWLSGRLDKLLE